jgi:Fe-S-cluster containining protein
MVELLFHAAEAKVPCEGCVECCKGPNRRGVKLDPRFGDIPQNYETEVRPDGLYLSQNESGDCVYLTSSGCCSIYTSRPAVCRWYDCRILAFSADNSRIHRAAHAAMARGGPTIDDGD